MMVVRPYLKWIPSNFPEFKTHKIDGSHHHDVIQTKTTFKIIALTIIFTVVIPSMMASIDFKQTLHRQKP